MRQVRLAVTVILLSSLQAGLGEVAQAQGVASVRRHLIVMVDRSADLSQAGVMSQASSHLRSLLFPASQSTEANRWKAGDCLSFAAIGASEAELSPFHAVDPNFWTKWVAATVHMSQPICPADIGDALAAYNKRVPALLNSAATYGLTTWALPAIFARPPTVFLPSTVVVRLSDHPSNWPQLMDLEAYAINGFNPENRSAIDAASRSFDATFGHRVFFSQNVGNVSIEFIQVSPIQAPEVRWGSPTARANQRRSGPWDVVLPALSLVNGSCSSISLSDPVLEIRAGGDDSRHQARFPVPSVASPSETSSRVIPNLDVDPSLVSPADATASLQAHVVCNAAQQFGISMGVTAESGAVLLPRHFKMTVERELEVVWAPIALVTLFSVWLLFLRRPELEIENRFGVPPFRRSRDEYDLEWDNGTFYVPISIRNSRSLSLRSTRISTQISEYPKYPVSADFGLLDQDGTTARFGDKLRVKLRPHGAATVVRLMVRFTVDGNADPHKLPKFERFDGSVTLKCDTTVHYVNFTVSPPLGRFWIGIDPGTTGACVAGGEEARDITTVPQNPTGRDSEERNIAPSLIYICPKDESGAFQYADSVPPVSYLAGQAVEKFVDDKDNSKRIFRSAKRLVGYDATNRKNARVVSTANGDVTLSGQDAVRMLIEYLLQRATEYFATHPPASGTPAWINKVVLAVPNTFTPAKIQQMKQCVPRYIQQVEHIYEAEAVLMYYLKQKQKVYVDVRNTERGERVIVFDFGGGSANYTYASIRQPGNKTAVSVQQRLGFCLGGDHLDWEIAHYIWKQVQGSFPTLNVDSLEPNESEKALRLELLGIAQKLKLEVSKKFETNSLNETIRLESSTTHSSIFDRIPVTAEGVLGYEGLINRLDELANGIRELIELCKMSDAWEGVDTLIFTGRSTRFPTVKERVEKAVGTTCTSISFLDDAKTSVAHGAAFWGSHRDQITLERRQTVFAHYGMAKYLDIGQNRVEYVPLVHAGTEFIKGTCFARDDSREYPYNSRIELYQLMGADPKRALLDPDKYARRTVMAQFRPRNRNVKVDSIQISLHDDDTFNAELVQRSLGHDSADGMFAIHDIGEDTDKTAQWWVG